MSVLAYSVVVKLWDLAIYSTLKCQVWLLYFKTLHLSIKVLHDTQLVIQNLPVFYLYGISCMLLHNVVHVC